MEKPDYYLATAVYGDADLLKGLDPVNPSIDETVSPPRNPVEKFFQDREFECALEKSGGVPVDAGWNEPIGVAASSSRLGKAVRSEIKVDEDGLRVAYLFDSAGTLVDVRDVLPEIG